VFEGLDKNFLRQVHGIVAVLDESIADPINLPFIADHQLVEGAHVARKIALDQFSVRV
jgi:hypothetical protein